MKLLITVQYAAVPLTLLEIHLSDATHFHVRLQDHKINTQTTLFLIPALPIVTKIEIVNPCIPSPCGPNSQCKDIGGIPSCSCLPDYLGNAPNCRPECSINPECATSLACINQKCVDPCPGSCGINAECRVVNHIPTCLCADGYTGDPFSSCYLKPIGKNQHFRIIK